MKRVGGRLNLVFNRLGFQKSVFQALSNSSVVNMIRVAGRSEVTSSKLMQKPLDAVPHRGCSHKAAEQEVLPHGVLDSSQEQHEGDPLLRQLHVPPVSLLLPPAPAPARLRGHTGGAAVATGTQAGATQQTGVGLEHEL